MSAIQLRRCLRLLGTFDLLDGKSIEGKKRVGDLFFSTLHGISETAIMVFASVPFNIDYGENRSLTNELNDSFFDNANVCGYGFKNFILFEARPLKRDLDKLKFCKICRPAFERFSAKCIEIRARDTAKNEKPTVYYVKPRNINQSRAMLPESSTLNVKNISNKTNQKRNNMYRSSSANIEKVCKKMKKTLPPEPIERHPFGSLPENHANSRCIRSTSTSNIDYQSIVRDSGNSTRKRKINVDSDRDSDCSITDSLNEFSYSLWTRAWFILLPFSSHLARRTHTWYSFDYKLTHFTFNLVNRICTLLPRFTLR